MLYENLLANVPELEILHTQKFRWLVTGAAGFIGSNLVEALLCLNQCVIGLDNFTTGKHENIKSATRINPGNFTLINGSINDFETCKLATQNIDFVLHHAALISVPQSLAQPQNYHATNAQGFANILEAARANHAKRIMYASSSAVYGDSPEIPKLEASLSFNFNPENFLSTYALTKYMNELSAKFYSNIYGLECVGFRYFNVFGQRQDPSGAYAAVISKWVDCVKNSEVPVIFGDGKATRDFCSVQNIVLANLLAALAPNVSGKVFNIGCGIETSLSELLRMIYKIFAPAQELRVNYESPRAGDILRSCADISLARKYLHYEPIVSLETGLEFLKESLA